MEQPLYDNETLVFDKKTLKKIKTLIKSLENIKSELQGVNILRPMQGSLRHKHLFFKLIQKEKDLFNTLKNSYLQAKGKYDSIRGYDVKRAQDLVSLLPQKAWIENDK